MWSVLFIDAWYDLYQYCLSLTRFSPEQPRIRRCLLRCYDLSAKSKPRLIYAKSAKQISALIVVRIGFFLWSGLCRKEVFLTLFAKLTDFANQEVSIGNSSNPCTFGENPLRIGWTYTFALEVGFEPTTHGLVSMNVLATFCLRVIPKFLSRLFPCGTVRCSKTCWATQALFHNQPNLSSLHR